MNGSTWRPACRATVGRYARAGLGVSCAIGLAGCASGSLPHANVSDPAVFTTVHLAAAEAGVNAENGGPLLVGGPLTDVHMKRFFELTPGDYKQKQLRMDAMLDSQQRSSAVSQAVKTSLALDLSLAFSKAATQPSTSQLSTNSPKNQAAPANTGAAASTPSAGAVDATQLAQTAKATTQAVDDLLSDVNAASISDSPFDELDRVSDFYAAYVIKLLRVRGDSRVVSADQLADEVLAAAEIHDPNNKTINALRDVQRRLLENPTTNPRPATDPVPTTQPTSTDPKSDASTKLLDKMVAEAQCTTSGSRLVLLLFQAQVDAGSRPNYMTGLRVHLESATGASVDEIKIIRLHPTRTYDVEASGFSDDLSQALALTGKGSFTVRGVDVTTSANSQQSLEAQEKQKFLSRISKVVSFADAADHTFGFNFYPSNVQLEPISAFGRALRWLGGTPRAYEVRAYLEGGARDCAVLMVVPRSLTNFVCSTWYVVGAIDPDQPESIQYEDVGGRAYRRDDPRRPCRQTFRVDLPNWSPWEPIAATLLAGPTMRVPPPQSTTQPTTQPTARPAAQSATPPH